MSYRSLLVLAGLVIWTASGVDIRAQKGSLARGNSTELGRQAAAELYDAKRHHLQRIRVWGGTNLLGGLALAWRADRTGSSTAWSFGAMTTAWGLVNVGIASVGLATLSPPSETPLPSSRADERRFHDILLLNLGLNVAYAAVGGTMLGAAERGISRPGRWRGFGGSLLLQGAGLLVLDGIAFFASRSRLTDLLQTSTQVSVTVSPTRVAVRLSL